MAEKRIYIDCEFDGHNGALLSIALVREHGTSIHIQTTATARDPWVIANVVPLMDSNEAGTRAVADPDNVGELIREFMADDTSPVIVADSPVDIARFCTALMTNEDGGYEPNVWDRMSFEVHDVDCYPTTLPGAVQHNAWWDAMALRHRLTATPDRSDDALAEENRRLREALERIVRLNQARMWTATESNPETHWVVRDGQYAEIARAALKGDGL